MKRMYLVYKVEFENGKSYVGVTCKTLQRRRTQHESAAKHGSEFLFHKALRKYSPKWLVLLETPDRKEAYAAEQRYIRFFKCRREGYNSTEGGEGRTKGKLTSDERVRLALLRGGQAVDVYDVYGNFLKSFDAPVQAVIAYPSRKLDVRNVCACLYGTRKSHGGLQFRKKGAPAPGPTKTGITREARRA